MNSNELKDLLSAVVSQAKQVNILTGDHAQAIYHEAEKPARHADKDECDVEAATRAAMEYVGRLHEMVTPAWSSHYMDLFKQIFALPQVRVNIAVVGKQQGTSFNRNMVANVVQMMLQEQDIWVEKIDATHWQKVKCDNDKMTISR